MEYLLASADLAKDTFFEKKNTTEADKEYLRGQLAVYDDIIGLGNIVLRYKDPSIK